MIPFESAINDTGVSFLIVRYSCFVQLFTHLGTVDIMYNAVGKHSTIVEECNVTLGQGSERF